MGVWDIDVEQVERISWIALYLIDRLAFVFAIPTRVFPDLNPSYLMLVVLTWTMLTIKRLAQYQALPN